MPPNFYAIVAGIGSGTGRAAALRFSKTYTTVLLARKPSSYEPVVAEIRQAGGRAIGIAADVSDPMALEAAFAQMDKELPDGKLAAAIFNAASGLVIKPFLDMTMDDLQAGLATSVNGLFYFAQKAIPRLLDAVSTSPHPPSFIVTGATAALRGSAGFSTFAAGKSAQRVMVQSLAREFGPAGVHVAHVIIDGVIASHSGPASRGADDKMLEPEAIAETYWQLHTQHRSAFTQEMDLRPYIEKF